MEIKNTLNKPYTETQRVDFIVTNNHRQGYEIRETDTALEAWGYTQEEIEEQDKQARNNEIENKIKELQEMAIPEILNNHTQNIQIYQNVINSLRDSILE